MSLLVVNGRSWLTSSLFGIPVELNLPIPHFGYYATFLESYLTCGPSDRYTIGPRPVGTSSVRLIKNTPYIVLEWYSQTTTMPGLIDYILYNFREELFFAIANFDISYGLTSSSISGSPGVTRYGMIISSNTGSPHLTFEPQSDAMGEYSDGDIWMSQNGGFRIMMRTNDVSQSLIMQRPLVARLNDTVPLIADRFTSSDRVQGTNLGVAGVLSDGGYFGANSPGKSGSGFMNVPFQAGIYMPDSGTVAVLGNNFIVPSGSLIVHSNIISPGTVNLTASLNLNKGLHSIIINTGSITSLYSLIGIGTNFRFIVSGSGSQIMLNDQQVGTLASVSLAPPGLPAVAFNGDFYLYSGSGVSGSNIAYVRANNQWFTILSGSAFYSIIDGGSF